MVLKNSLAMIFLVTWSRDQLLQKAYGMVPGNSCISDVKCLIFKDVRIHPKLHK